MPDALDYHLLVLPEGGVLPLMEWSEPRRLDLSRRGDGRSGQWKQLCEDVVRWAHSGKADSTELFICLPDGELRWRQDVSYLHKLLAWAREHAWGARLSLVAGDDVHLSGELRESREALQQWMEAARQGRVRDLLQINFGPDEPGANGARHRRRDWRTDPRLRQQVLGRLRAAASRFPDRQRVLAERRRFPGPWQCVLDAQSGHNLDVLPVALVQRYGAREEAVNLVAVVDGSSQSNTVEKARRRYGDRCRLVATLGLPPSTALRSYCVDRGLGEPLHLRGDLELWFLLLRLNEPSLPWWMRGPPGNQAVEACAATLRDGSGIHAIAGGGTRCFRSATPGSSPSILVTSSFSPAEPGYCRDAAGDVGWLVDRAPLDLPLLVDPATNRQRLIRRIDRQPPDPAIWIHLGHGDGKYGLWEVGSNVPVPTEQWLQCFQGRQLALPLALFLTCKSADIARSFAQAGAGVAIGFEGEVLSDRCRVLADQVLKSVLAKGWQPGAILEGFSQGRSDLMALEKDPAGPIAFLST
jgi:hypothetical protein